MLDYAALLIAFLISTVSAYYSISGLTAIFAGAVKPIIVMGCALEIGKVITTVWLRKNWNQTGTFIKTYLSVSIIVLMLITSMGIFGFLSRAHLEQGSPSADIQSQIQLIEEKIKNERDSIASNRTVLTQMDSSVNEVLSRSKDEQGAARAVQIRRSQKVERDKLQKENDAAQQRIQKLQAERAPLASQIRKIEVEVGPIKYIAALIYGDNPGADFLERAVRWVIIVLVAVFDPLALALMLAVNRKRELDQINSIKANVQNTLETIEKSVEIQEPIEETPSDPEPPIPDPPAIEPPVEIPAEPEPVVEQPVVIEEPVQLPAQAEPIIDAPRSKKKTPQPKKKLESSESLAPKESLKLKKSLKSSEKSQDPNELSLLKDQLKSKKLLKKLSNDQ